MELYILPLGMANRMRSHMRMDSQSQSHALSRGGCALQRGRLSSLAAGQTGGGGVPIKLNYVTTTVLRMYEEAGGPAWGGL